MSFIDFTSYYLNNQNSFLNSTSFWGADSSYCANSMPLFQYNIGSSVDTFGTTMYDISNPFAGNNQTFNWGNWGGLDWSFGTTNFFGGKGLSFNWGNFGGFDWSWGSNRTKTSKKSNSSKQTLLTTNAWDLQVKGRLKSNKTCNEDYISELQPQMQEKVRQLEAFAKSKGIPFKICSGYRTAQNQQSLINKYGSRRAASVNGSPHRSGRAIDISTNGILTEAQCTILGRYAESIGLTWGGNWGGPGSKTQRERWHFDLRA